MNILEDIDVRKFLDEHQLDEKYAAMYIAELRRFVDDKENYTLEFDGNTIIIRRKIKVINQGLDYLEAPFFFKNITVDSLNISDNPSKLNLIEVYSTNRNKGFYLYGKNGVGKTCLVVALANHHYSKTKEKTMFVFWPDFIEKTKRFTKTSSNYINNVKYCERLIIDDLGQESITSWSRDDILSSIITFRLERNLFTIVTSNYLVDELKNLYTLRQIDNKKALALSNKLSALCPSYTIMGTDYRK